MSTYCGIIDEDGMEALALKSDEAFEHLLKQSVNNKDTKKSCYFEVDLTPSQVDIFRVIQKTPDSTKTAAKALIQFGGSDISVPNSDIDIWEEITKNL